jgi:hypothetical protein
MRQARIGMRAGRMAARGFKPMAGMGTGDQRDMMDEREDYRVRRGMGKGRKMMRRL